VKDDWLEVAVPFRRDRSYRYRQISAAYQQYFWERGTTSSEYSIYFEDCIVEPLAIELKASHWRLENAFQAHRLYFQDLSMHFFSSEVALPCQEAYRLD